MSAQSMKALEWANRTRQQRRRLKTQVGLGEIPVVDLIARPPDCVATLTIGELLQWRHRCGRERAVKILTELGIHELKTLGYCPRKSPPQLQLSVVERRRLVAALR